MGNSDWWPDRPEEGVVGINQFIADGNLLNKGIGTRMISQFVQLLMTDPKITEIRVDPKPDNIRAIRCYEKVEFKKIGSITILNPKALKAMAKHGWYLSNLVSFIRLNLFVKINLQHWLDHPFLPQRSPIERPIQGVLV